VSTAIPESFFFSFRLERISDVGINFLFGQVLHCQTLEIMRQTEAGGVPITLAHQYLHNTPMKKPFLLSQLSISMAYA